MNALRNAIKGMVDEGNGWLDDSQAEVVDAFNALVPAKERIVYDDEYDEEAHDDFATDRIAERVMDDGWELDR